MKCSAAVQALSLVLAECKRKFLVWLYILLYLEFTKLWLCELCNDVYCSCFFVVLCWHSDIIVEQSHRPIQIMPYCQYQCINRIKITLNINRYRNKSCLYCGELIIMPTNMGVLQIVCFQSENHKMENTCDPCFCVFLTKIFSFLGTEWHQTHFRECPGSRNWPRTFSHCQLLDQHLTLNIDILLFLGISVSFIFNMTV